MPASRWHQEITWNYNWFPDQKSVLQEKKWLLWITSKKWHHILVARTGLIVLIQDLVNDPVWDKAAHRVFCVKKLYGKEGVTKSMAWPVILSRVYFLIFGLGDYWWNLKQSYAHLKLQWFWKGNCLECQCTIFRSLKERANRERVGGGQWPSIDRSSPYSELIIYFNLFTDTSPFSPVRTQNGFTSISFPPFHS